MKKAELINKWQEKAKWCFESMKMNEDNSEYKRELAAKIDVYNDVILDIKELEEPEQEKLVVPQFVADFIGKNFGDSCPKAIEDAVYYMDKFNEWHEYNRLAKEKVFSDRFTEELGWWLSDNMVLFYKACTNGYSVEKEKLYRVRFPFTGTNENTLIQYIKTGNAWADVPVNNKIEKEYIDKFTEKEIKAIDERYWAFAEEVTE